MHRPILAGCILLLLAGCGRFTATQLQQTAQVQGCWPFGHDQPGPTRTPPLPATPTGPVTATATPTATAQPTWPSCTPAPQTPTRPPTPTFTPTPWTRPTPLPGITSNTPPINLSQQLGRDVAPAVALHPTDGWAALVWSNWLTDFPDEATVFVRVQTATSHTWQPGIGVNTGPVTKDGGRPAVVIDPAGLITVAFEQDHQAVIVESADQGQTWSDPQPLPMPPDGHGAMGFQLVIDQAGGLHALYTVATCADCYRVIHATRSGQRWPLDDQLVRNQKQLWSDLATIQINGQIRTLIAVSCAVEDGGCTPGPQLVVQDQPGGGWHERPIPGIERWLSGQVVQWIDLITFTDQAGQARACLAWGQYSQSGVFASCSADGGETWGAAEAIAFHAPEAEAPTPSAGTPEPGDEGAGERGYRPELLYEPQSDQLMAIWLLREATTSPSVPPPFYLVWSSRPAAGGAWQPGIDDQTQEPPLRLFAATRRSAARDHRIAFARSGLAVAVWLEVERDGSLEVYGGVWTPAALLSGGH